MPELKLQHSDHLVLGASSLVKTLMLEKTEGRRRSGCQRRRWLGSITYSVALTLSKLQDCSPWGRKKLETTQQLNNKGCRWVGVASMGLPKEAYGDRTVLYLDCDCAYITLRV